MSDSIPVNLPPPQTPATKPAAAPTVEAAPAPTNVQTPAQGRPASTPIDVQIQAPIDILINAPLPRIIPPDPAIVLEKALESALEGVILRLTSLPSPLPALLPLPEPLDIVFAQIPPTAAFVPPNVSLNTPPTPQTLFTPPPATEKPHTQILVPPPASPETRTSAPPIPAHISPAIPPAIDITLQNPLMPAPQNHITTDTHIPVLTGQTPLKPETLDIRIQRLTPPEVSFAPPETSPLLQGHRAENLIGTIVQREAGRPPVLSVFFPQTRTTRDFALPAAPPQSADLPVGTQIEFTPLTHAAPPASAPPHPENLPLSVLMAPQESWPVMEDLLQTLGQISPQIAQAMMNMTPSPATPAQMPPAMLFFMAAIQSGDLGAWIGNKALEILHKEGGRSNLLTQITQEGQTLSRVAAEPLAQDWRAVNLPMLHEGALDKITLYYKHEKHKENEGGEGPKGAKATRFIFDLSLSAMGKVQLDGLFRPVSETGKRLDLALRTAEPFSQATQSEMRRIYARALRETDITGELSFQSQPEQWVTITAEHKNALGVEV